MSDTLIVVNAGSSSLKFTVYQISDTAKFDVDNLAFLYGGQVSGIGTDRAHFSVTGGAGQLLEDRDCPEAVDLHHAQAVLSQWFDGRLEKDPIAIGHRIVHGGSKLHGSVVIDQEMLEYLESLASLAPLHQHNNLDPVRVTMKNWPEILQVACVDTAFHSKQDALHTHFALPKKYYEEGVRRYGFHGLSYQYISEYLKQYYPELYAGRVLVAHLGSGASACLIKNGRSVASSMGFTALDGLPMSTRPGNLDAGVVLWWLQQRQKNADQIQDLLYNQSGLKGMSGISGDMRTLLASDDPNAKLAVDYFCLSTAEKLVSMSVSTQGVDGLVFTAGVGEHSAEVRERICDHLKWMGVHIDPVLNQENAQDISAAKSRIPVLVIPTNEELVIAREALRHYCEQKEG